MTESRVTKWDGNGRAAEVADRMVPPPHNAEAERGVIGCFLLKPKESIVLAGEFYAGGAQPDSFFDLRNRTIMMTILAMADSGEMVDSVTLCQRLSDEGKLKDAGGAEYPGDCVNWTPSVENFRGYLKIVVDQAKLRRALAAAARTIEIVRSQPRDIDDALEQIEQSWAGMITAPAKCVTLGDGVEAAVREEMEAGAGEGAAISTGFRTLDRALGGFLPGCLYVIGASPGMGKTTLALNFMHRISIVGTHSSGPVPGCFFSYEMSVKQLGLKLIGEGAGLNWRRLPRLGEPSDLTEVEGQACERALVKVGVATIAIIKEPSRRLGALKAFARQQRRKNGCRIIFVDYLQRVVAPGHRENRYLEVAEISGELKGIAESLNIPVIALSQINRKSEDHGGKPQLSHLRESGSIEADADVVMLMYLDDDEKAKRNDSDCEQYETIIDIAKNRHGPPGTVRLPHHKKTVSFDDPPVTWPKENHDD